MTAIPMTHEMERVSLAGGKLDFSRLVYGVWRLADDANQSEAHVRAKIEAALAVGIDTFDHADIYGDHTCETLFGHAIRARADLRDRVRIITKCDIMLLSGKYPERRVKHYDTSPAHIRASVDNSLHHITVPVIDLLLLHRPDPLMDHHATGAVLDALIAEGKIRAAGVSNFMPWDINLLQSAMTNRLVVNQIEISLGARQAFTNGQIAKAQTDGTTLMAWSPLAAGALFNPATEIGRRVLPRLSEIAAQQGVGADAVALAWVLAHPARIMPVVGTNALARISALPDAFKVVLDRQTWFELWTLAEGKDVP